MRKSELDRSVQRNGAYVNLTELSPKQRAKLFGMSLHDYNTMGAFHEAGHAVTARLLGLQFKTDVTINETADAWGGLSVRVDPTEASYKANLVCCWAGLAVDVKRGWYDQAKAISEDLPTVLYQTDKNDADATAAQLALFYSGRISTVDDFIGVELTKEERQNGEALSKAAFNEAKTMIDRHWNAISNVAKKLLRSRSLTQDQVDYRINQHELGAA
jgi:hypothetical protein